MKSNTTAHIAAVGQKTNLNTHMLAVHCRINSVKQNAKHLPWHFKVNKWDNYGIEISNVLICGLMLSGHIADAANKCTYCDCEAHKKCNMTSQIIA